MNTTRNRPEPRTATKASPEELRAFLQGRGPCAFLDFEFNHSQDPLVNLVSCSLQWSDPEGNLSEVSEWWLHHDQEAQADLRGALEWMRDQGTTLVGFGMAAEARSLQALGLDPHSFQIVDLYAEWRQLTHNNEACEYGVHFLANGFRRVSTPPSFDKKKNTGCHTKVGMGLTAAVGQIFGIYIDSGHKAAMRDLILEDRPFYTREERASIMAYCSSDIHHLPDLYRAMYRRLKQATRGQMTEEELRRAQGLRGSYIASIAKMEAVGFPVNKAQILALRKNYDKARDEIIQDLVDNYFPFFVRQKKNQKDLLGEWVDKYSAFVQFVTDRGLLDTWPRTVDEDTGKPTDRLSREDKVLSGYDGIPEIHAYRQASKLLNQLGWFKEPDEGKRKKEGDFLDSIGSDGRQRAFLGPYGTQTGRNAAKASRFIPAMSSWLRCLIQPEEGWVICGIDWASQEFGIAAALSGDASMLEAYRSGDPYLYFAKKAGAVPSNGTKAEYSTERDLFKATTLGLQYGMGKDKLAVKLTVDTGRLVTVEEADRLIQLHKKVYPAYWKWLDRISDYYEKKKVLKLWDGWALLGDNENFLSIRNFPTQGTGSSTMREAIRRAHEAGLHVVTPLHDAIYILYRPDTQPDAPDILSRCMDEAVQAILGDKITIRQDRALHEAGHIWVEAKGRKYLEMLGKYLEPMDSKEDQKARLLETIFAPRKKTA